MPLDYTVGYAPDPAAAAAYLIACFFLLLAGLALLSKWTCDINFNYAYTKRDPVKSWKG